MCVCITFNSLESVSLILLAAELFVRPESTEKTSVTYTVRVFQASSPSLSTHSVLCALTYTFNTCLTFVGGGSCCGSGVLIFTLDIEHQKGIYLDSLYYYVYRYRMERESENKEPPGCDRVCSILAQLLPPS
jgi:hypothetical protein